MVIDPCESYGSSLRSANRPTNGPDEILNPLWNASIRKLDIHSDVPADFDLRECRIEEAHNDR